jgi:diacylglycerol kinase (ATP)
MTTAKVILNPYANRWNALKHRPEAEQVLKAAGIDYQMEPSNGSGHAVVLALEAVRQGFTPVIAAGGDGTISEVVNGMLQGAEGEVDACPPLGVLPLGSANDFVANLKLPVDLPSAAAVIAAGKTRLIDLGQIFTGEGNQPGRYFDNNSAVGLEPTITLIQQKIKFIHGPLRYLVATLIGVMQKPKWVMHLEWEGGSYDGLVSLVTVGNNPVTGGMFYMAPHADPSDGNLTFVYGFLPTRRKILSVLPMTMKPAEGSYVEHPAIHEINSTWLRIRSETPTPLHTDGEIQDAAATEVLYRVAPRKLNVLV